MSAHIVYFSGEIARLMIANRAERPLRIYSPIGQRLSPEYVVRRLVNGISIAPHDGCWNWERCKHGDGYGLISIGGKVRRAHQVAYELAHGPIPEGLEILHSCDNQSCINPDHLSAGTHARNMREAYDRGLIPRPADPRSGDSHWWSKLTEKDVRSILHMIAVGKTQGEIAAIFSVHKTTIGDIKTGRNWRRVSDHFRAEQQG